MAPHAFDVRRVRDVEVRGATGADRRIAALAAVQHGVVARRQLLWLGIGREAIQHRLETGRLHPLHRGVYAVGHPGVGADGRLAAAVLAAGSGGVLGCRAAALALGMLAFAPGPVEVIVAQARRGRPGLRLRTAALAGDEITEVRGIPVTTPARTLLDLAATARPQIVELAFHEAQYRRLTSPVGLDVLLERHPRRPGAPILRALLARGGRQRTRTEMEVDFGTFCDAEGLPRPDETNVGRRIHGRWIEADAVYLGARIIIELDGGSHLTERRFHDDRARDRANLAQGDWRTVRVTSRHLDHERRELAADLRALLQRRIRH
ncbi:MAG: hypothetical protein JWM73_792 [Solirubrobacterales bacterium]|nr:hypothetical protein [Solirubrobacterales bacterium]